MAKAHRSPLLGYNHNVSHLGHVFHVQTEDSGPSTPRLFTHLFYGGTILVSRKVEYEAMLPDDQVRTLMQTQHRTVIKDMVAGAFNERIVTFLGARGVSVIVPPPLPQPPPAPSVTTAVATAPITPPGSHVPTEAPGVSTAPPPPAAEAVPGHIPRRTTRPIEAQRPRNKSAPPAISARLPDARRPPFVRNAPPSVAKTASTDGVVIQRSVVIGGPNAGDARARIRPPVPYIVAGGSHQARPAPGDDAANPADAPLAATSDQVAGPPGADAAARTPGVFGSGVRDDKSLDEVILEYLAEDGD